MVSPGFKKNNYDSGSQSFQELLEVYSVTWSFTQLNQDSENDVVFLVQAQGFSSHDDIFNINSSLSWVGIKGEQSVEFNDVLGSEDGVFSGNILLEDGLEVFVKDFFSGHNIFAENNKNY